MIKLTGVIFLVASIHVSASEWQYSSHIAELFGEAEVRGTFVLYDVAEDTITGFNRDRANARFIPASTFKVPHTLIGLAEGTVESVDQVLPYGGEEQPFSSWENDMSLRDALPISNVPIYQELARRITLDRMDENLALLGYGNAEAGDVVDKFWLEGPLTISAVEQAVFLASLAQENYHMPSRIKIKYTRLHVLIVAMAGHCTVRLAGQIRQIPISDGGLDGS